MGLKKCDLEISAAAPAGLENIKEGKKSTQPEFEWIHFS